MICIFIIRLQLMNQRLILYDFYERKSNQFYIKTAKNQSMNQKKRSQSNPNRGPSKNKSNSPSITFLLLGHEIVGIDIPYKICSEQIKSIIKKWGATWNRDDKVWKIRLDLYKNCFDELSNYLKNYEKQTQTRTNIYGIPYFVLNARKEIPQSFQVKNQSYKVTQVINYNKVELLVDPKFVPFYDKLFDFQKISLTFGLQHHGRLLLGDEMGVGKTIQSLAIAYLYRHEWPLLIICPSSLRLNWQQEVLSWIPQDTVNKNEIQVVIKTKVPVRSHTKIMIISYDLAWKMKESLDVFKVAIADEAHYLKNTDNKRSSVLVPYLSKRKRIILLTGTPAFARPRQLYNLITIIRPDIYTDFKEYGYRYCEPKLNPWSRRIEFNGCQNTKELHYLIKDHVMIRRMKKQVLTQLPDKMRQKVIVQTDKNITRQICKLISKQRNSGQETLENMIVSALSGAGYESEGDERDNIMQAYILSGYAKIESIKEYVQQLLANNVKFLLFAHHKRILDQLQKMVSQKKYGYIRIDGQTPSVLRHENVKQFQENKNVLIALLSMTAAGIGLTFTAASTVVFAELHWTPGIMIQAEDRAHRIGQKNSVNCHYLIGQNTFDDFLYEQIETKVKNVTSFIDGKQENLEMQELSKGQIGKVSKKQDSFKQKEKKESSQQLSGKKKSGFSLPNLLTSYLKNSVKNNINQQKFCQQSDIDSVSSEIFYSKKRPLDIYQEKIIENSEKKSIKSDEQEKEDLSQKLAPFSSQFRVQENEDTETDWQ